MKNDKDRYWDCLDQAMEASHGGRIDEALAWLDEALKAHPAGAEAHNGRGEILWDEGRLDEALYEFGRATTADPKFAAAHLNRIELLVEEAAGKLGFRGEGATGLPLRSSENGLWKANPTCN